MLKKQSRAQMPMFSFPPDLNGLHGFWNFPCSHYMLNEAFLFTSCCALLLGRSPIHSSSLKRRQMFVSLLQTLSITCQNAIRCYSLSL